MGHNCKMIGVKDNSAAFLQYVDKVGLSMHNHIKVLARQTYDELIEIEVNGKQSSVSPRFAENIVIVCEDCEKKNKKTAKKKA